MKVSMREPTCSRIKNFAPSAEAERRDCRCFAKAFGGVGGGCLDAMASAGAVYCEIANAWGNVVGVEAQNMQPGWFRGNGLAVWEDVISLISVIGSDKVATN